MESPADLRLQEIQALLDRAAGLVQRLLDRLQAETGLPDEELHDAVLILVAELQSIVDRAPVRIGAQIDRTQLSAELRELLASIERMRETPAVALGRGGSLDRLVERLLEFVLQAEERRDDLRQLFRDPQSALSWLPDANLLPMIEQRANPNSVRELIYRDIYAGHSIQNGAFQALCLADNQLSVMTHDANSSLQFVAADTTVQRTYSMVFQPTLEQIAYSRTQRTVVMTPGPNAYRLHASGRAESQPGNRVFRLNGRIKTISSFANDSHGDLYATCVVSNDGQRDAWYLIRRDDDTWSVVTEILVRASNCTLAITPQDYVLVFLHDTGHVLVSQGPLNGDSIAWNFIERPFGVDAINYFFKIRRSAGDGRLWALTNAKMLQQLDLSEDRSTLRLSLPFELAQDDGKVLDFVVDARNRVWTLALKPKAEYAYSSYVQLRVLQLLR